MSRYIYDKVNKVLIPSDGNIPVDNALSSTSNNPVQNKVVKTEIDSLRSDLNSLRTNISSGAQAIGIPINPSTTPTSDGSIWITT